MNKKEAQELARQLGIKVKNGIELVDYILAQGWDLGVEHDTGDWVIFVKEDQRELARLA